MAVNNYTKGNAINLTAVFTKKSDGSFVDPGTVAVTVIDPTGASTTFNFPAQIVRDSAGTYHLIYSTTTNTGDYTYRWVSTGTGQAASEAVFTVPPSRF